MLLLLQETKQIHKEECKKYKLPFEQPLAHEMPRKAENSNDVKGQEKLKERKRRVCTLFPL